MDETLLAKYIFQETSENEKVKVEKWLSASESNRKELEHLLQKMDLSTRRYRPNTFNSKQAYQKWQISIQPAHSNRRYLLFRYSAAAIVTLFMGCGLYFFIQNRPVKIITAQCEPGQTLEIILPDSSKVTLAGMSTLSYPSKFKTPDRDVSMSGKAYFQVHRDSLHPFIIKTPSISVTVLGTSFQIQADKNEAEVLVHSGKVAVTTPNNTSRKILTTGMSSEWSAQTDQFTPDAGFNSNKLSWKTKIIKFKDTPLAEVIRQLNEYYNVKIQLPENYKSLKLTATFDNQSLSETLEIINETLNIQLIVSK